MLMCLAPKFEKKCTCFFLSDLNSKMAGVAGVAG
jgi:hypothetical protein